MRRTSKAATEATAHVGQREKFLSVMCRSTADGLIATDSKRVVTFLNQAAQALTGWREEEALGRYLTQVFDITDEEKRNLTESLLTKALREGAVASVPGGTTLLTRDGTARRIFGDIVPVSSGRGGIAGIVVVFRSIADDQGVAEELQRSEERYRLLFDNYGDPITVYSIDGTLLMVNSVGVKNLGGKPEDFVGKSIYDLHPEQASGYAEGFRQIAMSGKAIHFESEVEIPSGRRWFWSILQPVRDKSGKVYAVQIVSHDITERKQAEERLWKSEERLRLMLESAMDGITVADPQGIITDVNQRVVEIHGFSTKEEILGKNTSELIAPRDRQKALAVWQEGTSQGAVRYECSVLRADKSELPVEISAGALRDRQGHVIGYVGITRDVSDRKRVEDALRESEQRYRLLAENVTDVITSTGMNGQPVYISPSITRLLGYSVEEAMDHPPEQSLTPASAKMAREWLAKVLAGDADEESPQSRRRPVELEFYRKDGSTVWAETSSSIVRDSHGQPLEVVSVLRDISERKQAEHLFRTLFGSSPTGAYIAQHGKFQMANHQFEELTGYTEEELRGMHPLNLVLPDDRSMVRENAIKMLKGQLSPMYEFRLVNKDGQIRWLLEKATSIQYQGQRATLGVLMDITERKQAEQKIQETCEEERKLRSELQAEIKKRVDFTRGLVHELKTPLTSVIASSELLASELPEGPLLRMARNISRSADNLNKRVDELLDVARGEMGMLQLSLTTVDPLPLLQELADEMSPVASNRQQSLVLDLPPFLPPVSADADRLRQVVLNLLGNACKFTGERGKITLRGRGKGDKLVVEVEDTGPGIGEEEQQQLFTPYYRVEGNGKRFRGLGLGLALCKTLVELHGGQIWVNSKKGAGSTFGFSVPLVEVAQLNEAR
ncbi:MAG: PAS domain S-box protein [Chloroflexi bacterium]|nr:PAS domain S-box protein [Chloroflexota bacterium]